MVTDGSQTLTHRQVLEAELADWRQVLGRIKARFRTRNFATGLELVNRIGAAAEAADHHPDLALTYPELLVTLSSHDVGGITSRDIELARKISAAAAELGVDADVSGITQLEIGLDTESGARHAEFYAALLGGQVRDGEPFDPSGQVPLIWWQEPDQEGQEPELRLPPQDFEQRWHFDVWVPIDEGPRRVEAALAAGGTLVSDARAPAYWVIADADGNRSCVCTVAYRD